MKGKQKGNYGGLDLVLLKDRKNEKEGDKKSKKKMGSQEEIVKA